MHDPEWYFVADLTRPSQCQGGLSGAEPPDGFWRGRSGDAGALSSAPRPRGRPPRLGARYFRGLAGGKVSADPVSEGRRAFATLGGDEIEGSQSSDRRPQSGLSTGGRAAVHDFCALPDGNLSSAHGRAHYSRGNIGPAANPYRSATPQTFGSKLCG